jgi:hypothetical protein
MSKNPKYKFKAAPSAKEAWKEFRANLAVTLSDLGEDEFLVIGAKSTNYFVQFAGQGIHGMRVEATSNAYLDAKEKLPKRARKQLLVLGWQEPTYVPSEDAPEPAEGSSNYFLDIALPVPVEIVAALCIDTLRDVYGVRFPAELEYAAYVDEQTLIRFPLLGLKRREQ